MEKRNKKYYFIAITGESGSGKTTVSNILREYGYYVFDTDLFSKKILTDDKSVMKIIQNIVGKDAYKNYRLDFKKVGNFFDNNPDIEKEFESWYQIFLGKQIIKRLSILKNYNEIIFFDIPLLYEKNIINNFDYLWIINSQHKNCYERIKLRNNYTDEKIKYIIKNSRVNKTLLKSNYKIIYNNKSIEDLKLLIKSELYNLKLNLK